VPQRGRTGSKDSVEFIKMFSWNMVLELDTGNFISY